MLKVKVWKVSLLFRLFRPGGDTSEKSSIENQRRTRHQSFAGQRADRMLLVNHYQYGEPSATMAPQQRPVSLLGPKAVEKLAAWFEPRDQAPLAVAIEDVTCADAAVPVLYTFRVSCNTHSASWIMPSRRYNDFEALHKTVRKSCATFHDELPSKFLLVPSRAALVQRAAGLQRYCNELLCNPEALGCTGVATFFHLDKVCT